MFSAFALPSSVSSSLSSKTLSITVAPPRIAGGRGWHGSAIPDAAALVFAYLGVALALHGRRALPIE